MGRKILQVSSGLLDMLVRGTEIHCEIEKAVPDNAKFVMFGIDLDRSIIELYYECPDWPEITDQSKPPVMDAVKFKKIEMGIA